MTTRSLASDTTRPPLRDPLQSHLDAATAEPDVMRDLRRIPAVSVEVRDPPIPLSRTHCRLRRPGITRLQLLGTADLVSATSRHAPSVERH